MITALVLLASQAHAVNYTVKFCANYSVDYDDADPAVGDDYFTSNSDRPARGARVRVMENGTLIDKYYTYTDWTGANEGCTTSLTLDSTKTYRVSVHSRALVNGNYINVLDNDATNNVYVYTAYANYSPTSSTTVTFDTSVADQWNIAAAAGWAMYRRAAGLSGENFDMYTETCPSGSGSCRSGNAIYLGSPADSKYVINHEFGHLVAYRKNGNAAASSSYAAVVNSCFTNDTAVPSTTHEANSKEYQSAAANEGYGHYYAAVAFNQTDQSDCAFAYYKSTDWDLDAFNDDIWVSCEAGPIPGVDGGDYLGDWCTGTLTNRGTEWDWLRFLWDLDTDAGASTTTIFDIYNTANPNSWNATGDSTGSAYPATRLRAAANTEGVLTEWDTWDNYNGVER